MPTLQVGEIPMHYVEQGTGTPLLLVHGFPLDHSMWEHQIAAFSQTHRVIAPDLRGFGGTPAVPETVMLEQYADDLAHLLDALGMGEPVVFCGLSMGGYIAWQFWNKYASRLARLILCDTRSAADNGETAMGRLRTAEQVEQQGLDGLIETMKKKLFAPQTATEQPEVIARTEQMMRGASREGVAAALRGMAVRADMTSRLSEIRVPTLLLGGALDAITPPQEMQEVAAAIPGARWVEIPNAGHMAPLEQPAAVNRAIAEFLRP